MSSRTLLLVGTALSVSSTGWAQSSRSRLEFESLSVIPGFYIEVNGVPPTIKGLSPDSLRADIASVLDRNNITILTQPEWQQTIGNPAVHLVLQLLRLSSRQYFYTAALEVRQLTLLMRDSTKMVYTRTWSSRKLLGAIPSDKLTTLRERVQPLAAQLARAYWSSVREAAGGRGAPRSTSQKKKPRPNRTIQRLDPTPSPKRYAISIRPIFGPVALVEPKRMPPPTSPPTRAP